MKNELRVARAKRRVNQRDVALVLDVGCDRYWRIENGYAEPTPEEQAKLARFLKIPIEELFPGRTAKAS